VEKDSTTSKQLLLQIPAYIGALVSVGSLVFSIGVIYSDVDNIKKELSSFNDELTLQSQEIRQLESLRSQVASSEKMQEKLAERLDNIDKSLGSIYVGVARMEEKLSERTSQKK